MATACIAEQRKKSFMALGQLDALVQGAVVDQAALAPVTRDVSLNDEVVRHALDQRHRGLAQSSLTFPELLRK
jgi:hypothetical protein